MTTAHRCKLFSICCIIAALCALAFIGGCSSPQVHKENVSSVHVQEHGFFQLACYDAKGDLKWKEENRSNALSQTGEQAILDTFFRSGTAPTSFYLRLTNTAPAAADPLTTIMATEPPTLYGYVAANQSLAKNSTDWPTLALSSSHYEITSKTITITASGGTIGPVAYAVIASTANNTGYPIAFASLAQSRTLASGDSLQLSYKVRLQ